MAQPTSDMEKQDENILHAELLIELNNSFQQCDMSNLRIATEGHIKCALDPNMTFYQIMARLKAKGLLAVGNYAKLKEILQLADLIELRDIVDDYEKKIRQVIDCTQTKSLPDRKRSVTEGDSTPADLDARPEKSMRLMVKMTLEMLEKEAIKGKAIEPGDEFWNKLLTAIEPVKELVMVSVDDGSYLFTFVVFCLWEFLLLVRWCLDGTFAKKMKPICLGLTDEGHKDDLCVSIELQASTQYLVKGIQILAGILEEQFHGMVSKTLLDETEQCIIELERLWTLLTTEISDDTHTRSLKDVERDLRVLYEKFKDFEELPVPGTDVPFSNNLQSAASPKSRKGTERRERDPRLQNIKDKASALLKNWKERRHGLLLTIAVVKSGILLKENGRLLVTGKPGQGSEEEQSLSREEYISEKKNELLQLLHNHADNEIKMYRELFSSILHKEDIVSKITEV